MALNQTRYTHQSAGQVRGAWTRADRSVRRNTVGAGRAVQPGGYGTPGYDIIASVLAQLRPARKYPWYYPGEEPAHWSGLDSHWLLWGWGLETTRRTWCRASAVETTQEIWAATTEYEVRKDWAERFPDKPFPGDSPTDQTADGAGGGESTGNDGESAAGGLEVR